MKSKAALPIIEVKKSGREFEVHWDYQEAPESAVLSDRRNYLDAYIDGALAGLGIPEKKICCAVGRTGTVKRLEETVAHRLAGLLQDLLHPLVEKEHQRILAEAKLPPHLRRNLEHDEPSQQLSDL